MRLNRFRNTYGLTDYAFHCGYLQRAELITDDTDISIDLWHEGACYHVRGHERLRPGDESPRGRLFWISEESLTNARKQWKEKVKEFFGETIRTVQKDKRYTVTREWHGEEQQSWITRFCGEWIDHASTTQGAWLNAASHSANRLRDFPSAQKSA